MAIDDIAAECWIWYSIVVTTVVARYFSQWISLIDKHWSNFRPDDYIMFFATCTYTVVIASLYTFDQLGDNIDYVNFFAAKNAGLEREQYRIQLTLESFFQITLWSLKTCLLMVFRHLTRHEKHHRTIIATGAVLLLTFTVVISVLYTECIPFSQFFATIEETETEECVTWFRYNVTQLTLNLFTDIWLMVIFWLVLIKLNLPWPKKLMLLGIFSLGIFVIVAAILTKSIVFPYLAYQSSTKWLRWYVRELSTAMLVGNLTLCYPLCLFIWRYCKTHATVHYSRAATKWTNGTVNGQTTKRDTVELEPPHAAKMSGAVETD